jgi:hypothetical protein
MHSTNNKTCDTRIDDLRAKIILAEESGGTVEFSAEEAERMGAFTEDAISEADAKESNKVRE